MSASAFLFRKICFILIKHIHSISEEISLLSGGTVATGVSSGTELGVGVGGRGVAVGVTVGVLLALGEVVGADVVCTTGVGTGVGVIFCSSRPPTIRTNTKLIHTAITAAPAIAMRFFAKFKEIHLPIHYSWEGSSSAFSSGDSSKSSSSSVLSSS